MLSFARAARFTTLLALTTLGFVGCSSSEATLIADDEEELEHEEAGELGDENVQPAPVEDAGAEAPSEPDAGPPKCTILQVPNAPYLRAGLHPDASNALQYLKWPAARITQTIGNASASAGTHGQDGTAGGQRYSAATDLSVSGMTDAEVKVLIEKMTEVGFIAYFRDTGKDGWNGVRHVHAIWPGARMKTSLRNQVADWMVGKNALVSHAPYRFYQWSQCWRDAIKEVYVKHNP